MSTEQNTNSTVQASNWLGRAYAERRILAAFLNRGEERLVYPHSSEWPVEIAQRVAAMHGGAANLPALPNAGISSIANVEEPEALSAFDPVARLIAAPPVASFSYCWVELENLIATGAVADPLSLPVMLNNDDPKSLAEYSVYVGIEQPVFVGPTTFATTSLLNVTLAQAMIQDSHLILSYKLSKIVRPIIVGYEQGRCYLLKEYGRVIGALAAGIKRLLCLVYFGLDLTQRDMKIRGLDVSGLLAKGEPVNHFGQERLTSQRPPLVKDFLDEALTVKIPSRESVFLCDSAIQITGFQFEGTAKEGVPLNGGVSDNDALIRTEANKST